mmetsp:Transcript_49863/g.97567  ORF Transcript_49863/g.97567 Transcript_49863/m.97567 type:complete len:260 (-) Transcript_49863:138-917(-)|eukprot:CAMPEP_0194311918 /NCGR_PEP_ID=MMETSP0171-20130528/8856_1 /TAXON_ID=218684 /ORGANISM="Corethron pennatum, Strain L29A3" /LENGTH=259 /DNA_ID=CAMNT_0039066217 /DNA_START=27 /DNA_END=806 /DNA_ORIENTATION=-
MRSPIIRCPAAVALLLLPSVAFSFSAVSSPAGAVRRSSSLSSSIGDAVTLDGRVIRAPIAPLADFVLVRNRDRISSTSGGIFLPDQNQVKSTEGEVVAAGPGMHHPRTAALIPTEVQVGEGVVYKEYAGLDIKYCEEEMALIRNKDIMLSYEGQLLTEETATPRADWVLVRLPKKSEQESSGGIVVAASVFSEDLPVRGTVAAVGPGRFDDRGERLSVPVQVGEDVKFREYAGNDITITGDPYLLFQATDLLSSQAADE